MKQGALLSGAIIAALAILTLVFGRLNVLMEPAMDAIRAGHTSVLILDAGHGGEDGGAVSVTGVPESQINLEIALKLRDILGLYGTDPILLREDDRSLHDAGAGTLREKKRSDLENRVKAVEQVDDAVLISIHQNTFTSSRYQGTHVFFSPTEGSRALAEQIQTAVRDTLQPDNERAAKQIPDTVYLMNHITCPAVLIECGFLTNPEEEAKLRDQSYQRRLAAVIAGVWLDREDLYIFPGSDIL